MADHPWGAPTAGETVGRPHQSPEDPQQGEGHLLGVSLLGRGVVGAGRGLEDLPDWLVHLHMTGRILENKRISQQEYVVPLSCGE